MADDNKTEEEPSIEEILSSIRDIISEDDEAEAAEENKTDHEKEPEIVDSAPAESDIDSKPEVSSEHVDDDDDVLELTDLAEEDNVDNVDNNSDDPLAGIDLDHPEDDDLDIDSGTIDNDALDDIFGNDDIAKELDAEDEAAMTDVTEDNIMEDVDTSAVDDALVDKVAESATVGAMAKLAENIAISRTTEGVTLEDVVKESLRPMLKDWLDENLPSLIERLVSQELERLANKAVGK